MKNKKTLYILIPLVAIIWGVVIWRVIDYKPSSQDLTFQAPAIIEEPSLDTIPYKLTFDYKDPFLRNSYRSGTSTRAKTKKKSNNIKKVDLSPEAVVKRPEGLVYRGEVSGRRSELGLLEMDSLRVLVRENSVLGDYTIESVQSDSLIIIYKDKRFTYGKQ